jgi:hypothetical protein
MSVSLAMPRVQRANVAPPLTVPVPLDALASIAAGLATSVANTELRVGNGAEHAFIRLLETEAYEAWLIAWGPSGALDLHNHGGSHGAIQVVCGGLAERYTDEPFAEPVRIRRLRPGTGIRIPARRIHEVWNPGPDHSLSVHVYSPPLTEMTFFQRAEDGSMVAARTVPVGDVP